MIPKELYIEHKFKAFLNSEQYLLDIVNDLTEAIEFLPKKDYVQFVMIKERKGDKNFTQVVGYYPIEKFIDTASNVFMDFIKKQIKLK